MYKINIARLFGLCCGLLYVALGNAAGLSISNKPLYVTQPLAPNVIISPVYTSEFNEISLRNAPWQYINGPCSALDSQQPCSNGKPIDYWLTGAPFYLYSIPSYGWRVMPWPSTRVVDGRVTSEVKLYPTDVIRWNGSDQLKPLDHVANWGQLVTESRDPDTANIKLNAEGKSRYIRSDLNFLYYNKGLKYAAWPNLGDYSFSSYQDATDASRPFYHPLNARGLKANLAEPGTHAAVRCNPDVLGSCDESNMVTDAAVPHFMGQYWTYRGSGDVWKYENYTQTKWTDASMSEADKINFANWFTYWRSADLTARGMMARLVEELGVNKKDILSKLRIGIFHVDSTGNPVVRIEKRDSESELVSALGNIIYGQDNVYTKVSSADSGDGTIDGTDRKYTASIWNPFDTVAYFRTEYPYRDDPRPSAEQSTSNPMRSCRRNYEIVLTPDYSGLRRDNSLLMVPLSPDGTAQNYDLAMGAPYADAWTNTLGDVGSYGWNTDLMDALENNLLPSKIDENKAQHLVRYVIGPSDYGTVFNTRINSYDAALAHLKSHPASGWSNPVYSILIGPTVIDELWHMALNSRGFFYGGENVSDALDKLLLSLNDILVNTTSGSSVATSTTSLSEGDLIYQATVDNDWKGHLRAYRITQSVSNENTVLDIALGTPEWDLAATVSADGITRKIATYNGLSGVPFQWAGISDAVKNKLKASPPSGITDSDVYGQRLLEYLRGNGLCEEGSGTSCTSGATFSFRRRNVERNNHVGYSATNPFGRNILGDIANSNPWLVAAPVAGPSDVDYPGYNAFRVTNKSRQKTLYVGANDGMLHAVNASNGNELFAYVPSFIHDGLHELSKSSYEHKYYVDGSPFAANVNIGGWKTLLAGGANRGGMGYYLLDVTNPTDNNEGNSAGWVKWEFTHSDMHYTYNMPVADNLGQARQFVRINDNSKMALIVGNGYPEAADKQACVFIIYLTGPTGADKTWVENQDYRKLCAGGTSYSADGGLGTNGLSTPTPFDSDGDGKVDVIYAGDLNGNMWRFNVGSSNPLEWGVAYGGAPLFVAKNAANKRQPIVAPPEITTLLAGSTAGQLLLFGTGKYIEDEDISNSDTQSFYGVWDRGLSGVTRTNLIAQVQDAESRVNNLMVRTQSNKSHPSYCSAGTDLAACGTTGKHLGWYWDMPTSGERLTGKVSLINGMVFFNTFFPFKESYVDGNGDTKYRLDPCKYGGDGWLMGLNAVNGYIEDRFSVFDVNQDGIVDSTSDAKVAGIKIGASMGGTSFARGLKDTMVGLYAPSNKERSDKDIGGVVLKLDPAGSGRVSWFELLD